MQSLLPAVPTTQLDQRGRALSALDLDGRDAALVLVHEDGLDPLLERLGYPGRLSEGSRETFRRDRRIELDLCPGGVRLVIQRVDPAADAASRLSCCRGAVAALRRQRPADVTVACEDLGEAARGWAEAGVAALLAADQPLPDRARDRGHHRVRSVSLRGGGRRLDLSRLAAEAEGAGLTRWLATLPPNELQPASYRELARTLAAREGWTISVMSEKQLARRGAGAFLAVAQGNPRSDAALVKLSYRNGGERTPLALVGKGITFDTGGVNLKPHASMLTMHGDMQGSAVALGSLLALSRMGAALNVDCWLALAENCIDGAAYKPHDVVTAVDGTTIETVHTDAEGRMVLADTLALVSRSDPALILDFATLTGACVRALTYRYSGVFSNRQDLYPQLTATGSDCGERVWPFPMDADFDDALRSTVADVKQCAADGAGDHIMAARFLGRFVREDIPWVHMDLSSSEADDGVGHLPGKFTGFGVRYTLALLLDARFGRRVPRRPRAGRQGP